jgi:HSP20 family molecular chaperone IbpA
MGFGGPLGFGMLPSFGLPSMPSLAGPPTTAMGTQAAVGDPGEGRVNPLWVDVFEAPDHFRLVADVPGIRKENVKINLQRNNILCIQADRMYPRPDDEQQILSCERDYGRYRRHLRLPADCDRDKMQAKCLDGQLIITIPRRTPGQIEEQLPEERVSVPLRDKSVEQPREQEKVTPQQQQVQPISPQVQQRQFEQPVQQQQQQQSLQGQAPSTLGVGLPLGQKEKELEKEKEYPTQWKEQQKEKEKEYPTQQREPTELGIRDVSGTGRPSTTAASADLLSDAGAGRAPTLMPQQLQEKEKLEKEKEKPYLQPQQVQVPEEKRRGITEPSPLEPTAAAAAIPSVPEMGVREKEKEKEKPELMYKHKDKEEYEKEQMRGLTQPSVQPTTQPLRPLEREREKRAESFGPEREGEQIQPSEKFYAKEQEPIQAQEKPSLMEKFKGALGLGQRDKEKERERGWEREREKEPISSYTATQGQGKEQELPLGFKDREKEKISPASITPLEQGKGFEQGQEQQFRQYPSTSSYGPEQEREREQIQPKVTQPSEKLYAKEQEPIQAQEKPSLMEKVKGTLGLGQREQEETRGWEREREKPSTGVSSMLPLPQQQKWESQGPVTGQGQVQTQQQGLGVQPELGVGLAQQQQQKPSLGQERFGVQTQPTSVGDLSQGMQQRDTAGRGPESQQWGADQVPPVSGSRITQRRPSRDIPVQLGVYRQDI